MAQVTFLFLTAFPKAISRGSQPTPSLPPKLKFITSTSLVFANQFNPAMIEGNGAGEPIFA